MTPPGQSEQPIPNLRSLLCSDFELPIRAETIERKAKAFLMSLISEVVNMILSEHDVEEIWDPHRHIPSMGWEAARGDRGI